VLPSPSVLPWQSLTSLHGKARGCQHRTQSIRYCYLPSLQNPTVLLPVPSHSAGIGEGDLFNSLCGTESHSNDQEARLKPELYSEWQWNYKRWQLCNFITLLLAQWGWRWILTWQKVSTTQRLISQNHKIKQVDKLIPTLPLWAEKVREREREKSKERNKRKDITTLESSGSLCQWSGSSGGGPAPPSGACLIASWKFSKTSQWACGGRAGSWWSHIPPLKTSAQLPCLHDIVGFHKPTPCLSLSLQHSLIKMRNLLKHNAWFRSLLNSSIFISFSRCLRQLPTPAWGCKVPPLSIAVMPWCPSTNKAPFQPPDQRLDCSKAPRPEIQSAASW